MSISASPRAVNVGYSSTSMSPNLLRWALLGFCLAGCSGDDGTGAGSGASAAPRWYVDLDAPSGGDGTSWARASRDLATVLAQVRPADEVWVASGTYRPAPAGGTREASFVLVEGLRLYGGFGGGETSLAARDPAAHPTILDGDLAGDDGPDFTNRADNSYQVVVATDAHLALIDGFTIRGGYADGPGLGATPDSRDQGSGINVYHGPITVRNCTLTENWASNHGTVNDHSTGSVFEACAFVANKSAQFGAGLYLHHEAATSVFDCLFQDNESVTDGAGCYVRAHHGARIDFCRFEGNRAERGGGMYAAPESAPFVTNCTFIGNDGRTGGGGSYNDESFAAFLACEFVSNSAGVEIEGGSAGAGGSGGGGIWTNGGAMCAMDCVFRRNTASFGGGFYAIHEAHALVLGSHFENNHAEEAGGMYTLNSPVTVLDSTFVRNVAENGSFSVGGGMSNYFSDGYIERCSFYGNRAELGGGGLYAEGEDPIVRKCRFVGNSTRGLEAYGGALMLGYFTRGLVEDCSFVGNDAKYGGGTYDIAFSEMSYVNCTYSRNLASFGANGFVGNLGTPRFANCILEGGALERFGGLDAEFEYGLSATLAIGVGNVAGVPTFVRPPSAGPDEMWGTDDDDGGDLRLSAGSPGIDAGRNDAHTSGKVLDLGLAPRFVDDPTVTDVGVGEGPLVDMGAFERQP